MSVEFRDQVFQGWSEFDSGRTHSGIVFANCEFRRCVLALHERNLSLRPRVSNVEFKNCAEGGCQVIAAVVEDAVIDGLKTASLFQTWAAVFKHVTLKGRIDRMMLGPFFSAEESPYFSPGKPPSKFRQALDKANSDYYATVDWALDIRDVEFKDFDCRGIPSRLVRRDPETQIMVTRERVLASGNALTAGGEFWHGWLDLFLQDSFYSDAVLIAPKRSPQFKELLTGLHQLRRAGVAEPD